MAQTEVLRIKAAGSELANKKALSKGALVVIVATLCAGLAYVHIKFEQTRLGYEISANNGREKDVSGEALFLKAEIIKLKSPARVEDIARGMGFKFPTQQDVIYIEEQTVVGDRE
ncbi:MAG: hypothetical protein ACT4NX_07600 [Deltaproteobacteria bacterium]